MAGFANYLKHRFSRLINPRDYKRDYDDPYFSYFFTSEQYKFQQYDLCELVERFYTCNPVGYSVINKIVNAHRELDFYEFDSEGQPDYNKLIDIDFNFALFNLLTTGTAIFKKVIPVGFSDEDATLKVLNTLLWKEDFKPDGTVDSFYDEIKITDLDNYIFITLYNPVNEYSNLGLSPLQACMMPLHALNEMYTADATMLQNKGVDAMITNDSDTPITGVDSDDMDKELNRRIGGARKHGGVATSTSKLRVLNLGRTSKELALWEGYKYKLRDVCNVLSVDSSHFNDPDNKKFSNLKEAQKSLYTNCVLPYNKLIVENKKLVEAMGMNVYCDKSDIASLQEDQKVKAEKNKTITDCIVNLNKQVQEGTITKEIAENILIKEWSFTDEEARQYIGDKVEPDERQAGQVEGQGSNGSNQQED